MLAFFGPFYMKRISNIFISSFLPKFKFPCWYIIFLWMYACSLELFFNRVSLFQLILPHRTLLNQPKPADFNTSWTSQLSLLCLVASCYRLFFFSFDIWMLVLLLAHEQHIWFHSGTKSVRSDSFHSCTVLDELCSLVRLETWIWRSIFVRTFALLFSFFWK